MNDNSFYEMTLKLHGFTSSCRFTKLIINLYKLKTDFCTETLQFEESEDKDLYTNNLEFLEIAYFKILSSKDVHIIIILLGICSKNFS